MFPLQLPIYNTGELKTALERIKAFVKVLTDKQSKDQGLTTEEVLYLRSLGMLLNQIAQARTLSKEDWFQLEESLIEQADILRKANWFLLGKNLLEIIGLCAELGYGLQDQQLTKWLQTVQIMLPQLSVEDRNKLKVAFELIKKNVAAKTSSLIWPEANLGKVEQVTFEQRLAELDRYHRDNSVSSQGNNTAEISKLEAKYLYQLGQAFLLPTLARNDLSQANLENYLAAAQHIGRLLQNAELKECAFAWYCQLTQINSTKLNPWLGNSLVAIGELVSSTKPHLSQTPNWIRNHKALKNQHDALEIKLKSSNAERQVIALTDFNKVTCQFMVDLLQTIQVLLGISPAKFCVMALGSTGRNMLKAYLDFECAVVVENVTDTAWKTADPQGSSAQQRAFYLKNFFELFEFKIRSMGELRSGILDDASQPRTELLILGTPEQLAKNFLNKVDPKHDGIIYSLMHPLFLYGDNTLGDGYFKALNTTLNSVCEREDSHTALLKLQQPTAPVSWYHYWVMAQLKRNQAEFKKYFIKKTHTPDLTEPYVKLLSFLLFDMALYHKLPTHDLVSVTQHLKRGHYLETWFIDCIVGHLKYLQDEYPKQHAIKKEKMDSVQDDHQLRLDQIYREVLMPFYTALPILFKEGYASFQQALWLELALTRTLVRENTVCEAQVLVSSQLATPWHLPASWCDEVFDVAGNIKPTSEMRNSAIFSFGNYCLKIIEPDENNLQKQQEVMKTFLAREYAVNHLARLLGFNVTVPGCAVWLRYKTAKGKEKFYAGWLCEKIAGRDLSNVSLRESTDLQQIDADSYTALFLLSLLIYPEDGQLRNFLLAPDYGVNGKSYRLVSIDNKRVFINAIETTSSFLGVNKTQILQLKTALFFLPQFNQLISPSVIRQATRLDMVSIIRTWSDYLNQFDAVMGMALNLTNTKKTETKFAHLAIDPFLVSALPLRYQQIIKFLYEIAAPTPKNVLEKFEPEVEAFYRELKKEHRLLNFGEECKLFADAYNRDQQGHTYPKTTWQNLQTQKIKPVVLAKQLFQTDPQLIPRLDWQSFDKIQQYALLQMLQTLSHQQLYLANCVTLTEADLLVLLQNSPNLTEIDISGCNLTKKVFEWFAQYNRNLITIRCNNNQLIKTIKLESRLKKLENLYLENCSELSRVDGSKVPSLQYVYVNNFQQVIKAARYALAFYHRGIVKNDAGNYEDAIADFDEAITLDPEYALAFHRRGDAKYHLGRCKEAIADYDQAIVLNAKDEAAFNSRAVVQNRLSLHQQPTSLQPSNKKVNSTTAAQLTATLGFFVSSSSYVLKNGPTSSVSMANKL